MGVETIQLKACHLGHVLRCEVFIRSQSQGSTGTAGDLPNHEVVVLPCSCVAIPTRTIITLTIVSTANNSIHETIHEHMVDKS